MEIFNNISYQDLLSDETPIPHDVVFTFDGEHRTLSAHRLVLSLASPYFRTLFYGPFEAIPRPHTIAVVEFSILQFERMLFFVYACLANKKEDYVLVDEREKITGQQDIKTVIETYRVADYYGLSALAELCAEAMERISVIRENVSWLHSFLRVGPGEEALQEKVGQVLQIMNQLEARREGRITTRLRSYKRQAFGDKSEEWLKHELDCDSCDIIVLRGPTSSWFIGTYKKNGAHNKRPMYKMIHDVSHIPVYIYYADGYWAVDLAVAGMVDVVLNIPDESINGGPPVYTPSLGQQLQPQTGFSLSCGYPSVCQKIRVACEDPDFDRPDLLGDYEATGTYNFGVMEYEKSDGSKLPIGTIFTDEKHVCPCQAQEMVNAMWGLGVTCSDQNCLCSHHAT